jgi:protein SERAC1
LIARGAAQDHLKSLLESTFAIAFMGTPHMGSTKPEWAGILSRLSSVLRQTNRNILSVLEPGSEVLDNVQQEFHTMLDDRSRNRGSRVEIHCFYEEVAVLGIGKVYLKSCTEAPVKSLCQTLRSKAPLICGKKVVLIRC